MTQLKEDSDSMERALKDLESAVKLESNAAGRPGSQPAVDGPGVLRSRSQGNTGSGANFPPPPPPAPPPSAPRPAVLGRPASVARLSLDGDE
jgi:hypothetical protein